jgi:anti-sigma B factor antagonist
MTAPSGPDPGAFAVHVDTVDGSCTVTVTGDVDVTSAPVLAGCLQSLLARPELTAVDLDLSGVTFLNAAGLRALAVAHRTARTTGTVLRVHVGRVRAVLRPLEITGLASTFAIDDAPVSSACA